MNKRNLEYENKFKTYLFNGDIERFKQICENLSIINNLQAFKQS